MTCGVYCITNTLTGDQYIGSSNDIERRWAEHRKPYHADNRSICPYLAKAISKYSLEAFHFSILEETANLTEREQYWIDFYKPRYNLRQVRRKDPDGFGWVQSQETREKISKGKLGKPNFGLRKPKTAEHRARLSAANKGKHQYLWGHVSSAKQREAVGKINRGKPKSPEVRAKISKSLVGKKRTWVHSPEGIAKLLNTARNPEHKTEGWMRVCRVEFIRLLLARVDSLRLGG